MNPFTSGKTWIDVLLNPQLAAMLKPNRVSKHAAGHKLSPTATEDRRKRNQRERKARAQHYKRMKS